MREAGVEALVRPPHRSAHPRAPTETPLLSTMNNPIFIDPSSYAYIKLAASKMFTYLIKSAQKIEMLRNVEAFLSIRNTVWIMMLCLVALKESSEPVYQLLLVFSSKVYRRHLLKINAI